ncbi:MAG TPA: TMEM175 family protein [Lysobacter sp.]|nr:TMEM175 family protein [Lysobacter sp.]
MQPDPLPRDSAGFRIRGAQPTRMETFVDAAFAFAVTLLVITLDPLPNSVQALVDALKRVPAFLAGFAILAVFWLAHRNFSRRTALEDGWTLLYSLLLVAVTLVYVFPLRMLMAFAFHHLSGGWLPSALPPAPTAGELRLFYVVYGVGFAAMATSILLMYRHALRRADALGLDAVERLLARQEIAAMAVLVGSALLSIALALLVPPNSWLQGLPGMVYGLLPLAMGLFVAVANRQMRALQGAEAA